MNAVQSAKQLRKHIKKSIGYARVAAAKAASAQKRISSCDAESSVQTQAVSFLTEANSLHAALVAYYATL